MQPLTHYNNNCLLLSKLMSEGIYVKADRDCSKGQQLFEVRQINHWTLHLWCNRESMLKPLDLLYVCGTFQDYGDNDNRLYLGHHGFIPEVNPFDCAWGIIQHLEWDPSSLG